MTNNHPGIRATSKEGIALDQIAFAGLCAFVFTMPWEEAVPLLGGFVISRWIALLVFGVLTLRVAVARQVRRPVVAHGFMLILVVWSALSFFWTVDQASTLSRGGTFIQLLFLAWMIWELVQTNARAEALIQTYVCGATVLAASTLYNFMIGRQAADLAEAAGPTTKYHDSRYTMAGVNENDLGLMLALSVPMTLYLMTRRKNPLAILFLWVHVGLTLTALFLSGSRGGLISTGVGMLMFPLMMSRLPRWQRLAFVAVCAVGVVAGAIMVPEVVWERLASTGSEVTEGTLTHRTVLWDAGLEAFRDHPIAGVGAGAYGTAIVRAVDVPLVAHNSYLSVMVEMGVVGALMWVTLIVSLFHCVWGAERDVRRLWGVVLLTWMVGVFALTWEYHKTTWFVFGLAVAHAYSARRKTSPHVLRLSRAEVGIANGRYRNLATAHGGVPAPQPAAPLMR